MMHQIYSLVILITACGAVDFEILNKEIGPVWIGIQSNGGKAPLEKGGFKLDSGQSRTIQSPENWEGRFWARTWCDGGTMHCLTGDCGNKLECGGNGGEPPATLAEIRLKGDNNLDFYDISLVDGFNIPASMEPIDGQSDSSPNSCKTTSCSAHINDNCPNELKDNSEHGVIGCKSACVVFHTDQYCCKGQYTDNCPPTDYSKFFKNACPDAYSYAKDDPSSTYTCKAQKYKITFGG